MTSSAAPGAVAWTVCNIEQGPGSARHQEFLRRLTGKKIVFMGDCLLRFQYLELAYYLIRGHCPPQTPQGYILSTDVGQWPETSEDPRFDSFVKGSSRALNTATPELNATETVFATALGISQLPLRSAEYRTFLYHDNQGRKIELTYIFYYTEFYGAFDMALRMAQNSLPTDVVTNFGVWLRDEPANTTCGLYPSTFPVSSMCPHMPSVCGHFTGGSVLPGPGPGQDEGGGGQSQDFNLFWASTTPAVQPGASTLLQLIPAGHNLHVPGVCSLPEDQILDRVAMLNHIEPDPTRQAALYGDPLHFSSPDVDHAFNWQLLDRLTPLLDSVQQSAVVQSSGCMLPMHAHMDSVLVATITALLALLLASNASLFS